MKYQYQRIVSLFLALLTVFTAVAVPVFAEDTATDASTQAALESIYDSVGYSQELAEGRRVDLTNVPTLNGVTNPTATAYKIDSLAAYQNFVTLVNNGNTFSGKTVYLACNLDLSSIANQAPIGFNKGAETTANTFTSTASAKFSGTLNGQGYAITGISITKTLVDTCYSAFIGWAVNATVIDLVLSGTVVHENGTYSGLNNFVGTGGLIAMAEGTNTVDNVYCDIDVKGLRQTAGFVGRGGATVTNSTNAGNVIGSDCAGGFFGFVSGTASATNCLNTGRMAASKAGGILSRGRVATTIDGCVNVGSILSTANNGFASGIVGVTDSASANIVLKNCTNYGFISDQHGTANGLGTQSSGVLTIDETNVDVPYVGYVADGFIEVDLSGIPNISQWTSSSTEKAYQINDAAGMVTLATLVKAGNTFQGITIYLACDVDMSSAEDMIPIGYYAASAAGKQSAPFKGIFDGQGHAIKCLNMVFESSALSGLGLFGYSSGATIRNLVIDRSCSFAETAGDAYAGLGALLGISSNTTIFNVANYASVFSLQHAAGLVGRDGVKSMKYCSNYGTVISYGNDAGGLGGFRVGGTISHCANYGTVVGPTAGGLLSRVKASGVTYRYLVNYGSVYGDSYAGGIMGRTESGLEILENCSNYGYIGGIIVATSKIGGLYSVFEGVTDSVTLTDSKDQYAFGVEPINTEHLLVVPFDLKNYDSIAPQKAYVINDADGWMKLVEIVNAGNMLDDVQIYLGNDINLMGYTVSPVGTPETPFRGDFDGRGHTVRGLNMKIDSSVEGNPAYVGLFGFAQFSIIKNLTVDATCSFVQSAKNPNDHGSIAAILGGGDSCVIENVKNQANVTGALHAGGIGGRGSVSAINCVNTGTVKGANSAGGIFAYGASHIIDCTNYGDVSASTEKTSGKAGGLAGRQEAENTLYINSKNYGTVTADYMAGGAIGAIRENCYIINCTNYGLAAPIVDRDALSSNRYLIENGYLPTLKGNGVADLTSIGYSAAIAEAEKVDLKALLACGIAKNIEDYNHATDNGVINHLIIDSAADLQLLAKITNDVTRCGGKTFYLACDIDMSAYTFTGDRTMAQANTITPIGWDKSLKDGVLTDTTVAENKVSMYFGGIFDGQGHTVSGLKMGTDDYQNSFLGLFGFLKGATVKNLILGSDCSFYSTADTNNFKAGVLAGGASASTVRNVWTQGYVSGKIVQAGGMIGRPDTVTFISCTNSANVNALGNAGGFGGFAAGMRFYSCRNTGNINGTSYAAGFSARDRKVGIYVQCVNLGNVTATGYAGAIAGYKDEEMTTLYASCLNYGLVAVRDTQTGKLFGGVKNASCVFKELTKTNHNSKADQYHIAQMLDAKYQIKDNGNGTFDIRLVASVDSLSYRSAGFILTVAGMGSATLTTNKVYTSILGTAGEETITYQPAEEFADTSKYFITYTVKNLSNTYLNKLGTEDFAIKAFLISNDETLLGYKKVDPIVVSNKLTAKVTTSIGTVKNFKTPQVYEIGNTGVTVNLQYQAWPTVTVDENGTLYATVSGRLRHVDPFGHTLLYKSTDNGVTWIPMGNNGIINDTPVDDRDTGMTYLGGGRMIITYFRASAAQLLRVGQSFVTADGVTVNGTHDINVNKGNYNTYTLWQDQVTKEQYNAVIAYWETLNYAELGGGNWVIISNDYGNTWSDPISCPTSTPHGAIKLSTGELLYVGRNGTQIRAYVSYDGGYSWNYNSTVFDKENNTDQRFESFGEPHVVELSNGRWLVAIRVEPASGYMNGNRIITTYSDDEGKTWSTPKVVTSTSSLTTINGEICGVPPHLIQLDNGAVVMTYASRQSNALRGTYAVISYDGGVTWDRPFELCRWLSGASSTAQGDNGYPATVVLKDGTLLTVYYQSQNTDSYASLLYTKWTLT